MVESVAAVSEETTGAENKKYGNCKAVQDSNWKSLLTSDPKLLLV